MIMTSIITTIGTDPDLDTQSEDTFTDDTFLFLTI